MSKVIAFMGSPRKKGNVDTIFDQIIKGANDNNVEIKKYYLNDMNIKGCQGCLYCRKTPTCAFKDDMIQVYDDIKNAEYIIIGSPVYICQVSAQTKLLLDRLYPLRGDTEIRVKTGHIFCKHIDMTGLFTYFSDSYSLTLL